VSLLFLDEVPQRLWVATALISDISQTEHESPTSNISDSPYATTAKDSWRISSDCLSKWRGPYCASDDRPACVRAAHRHQQAFGNACDASGNSRPFTQHYDRVAESGPSPNQMSTLSQHHKSNASVYAETFCIHRIMTVPVHTQNGKKIPVVVAESDLVGSLLL
jgi:hypothetical protein